ncbi:hypothetical protein SteCoe_37528 [Stentor coeruleus]|uniref:lipoate--protein ligase n=1 Tax=Stentor coeruleus TaxID=5963 RepID=A0A1R2AMU0_9CILI|nr:hypothetical protein SteCoe_37528 [Stentor coeruleus]
MKPRIVISKTSSIFTNLALEEFFAQEALAPILFLYQNSKTIVIGRNQNPWKEIYIDRMQADKVALCRRKSGGGTVYQDLGNTCFSFINPHSPQDFKNKNNSIVLRALNILDIEAETSGRNDIIVEGKKISGSAYKILQQGSHLHTIHHGTMLLNTELSALSKYLNPSKAKLESKGVKSVSARVANCIEFNSSINNEGFIKSMTKSYAKDYPDAEVINLDGIPPLAQKKAEVLQNWDWIYGESPQFSHELETRFKWGIFDMNMEVQDGVVKKCKIFSDCLVPDFVEFVEKMMVEKKYGNEGIDEVADGCPKDYAEMMQEVREWFKSSL